MYGVGFSEGKSEFFFKVKRFIFGANTISNSGVYFWKEEGLSNKGCGKSNIIEWDLNF